METTKTDHSLQNGLSGIRMWNMLIRLLVVSALKIEVDLFGESLTRVKPGFIGRQGSSDRSFYVSFTALPTDTCLERSYPLFWLPIFCLILQ